MRHLQVSQHEVVPRIAELPVCNIRSDQFTNQDHQTEIQLPAKFDTLLLLQQANGLLAQCQYCIQAAPADAIKPNQKMERSLSETTYADSCMSAKTARKEDIQSYPVLSLSQWSIA